MESDTEVSAHTDVDTKVFDTDEKRHMPVVDPSLFPDGGLRAWSVVAASFLLVFCTFGNAATPIFHCFVGLLTRRHCKWVWNISDVSFGASVEGIYAGCGCVDWIIANFHILFRRTV